MGVQFPPRALMKNATPIHRHIRKTKRNDYLRVLILRTFGNFLVLSSVFMVAKTFYQPIRMEFRYFVEQKAKKQYVVATTKEEARFKLQQSPVEEKGGFAGMLAGKPVEALVPEDPNFSIVIPKIGANARILANIDASNEQIYLAALQQGVGHVMGTAFPGEGGHVFLFAHSTDYFWNVGTYNAVFYLLGKLESGDEVNVFYRGQRYRYHVIDQTIVDPSQVEYLTRKTNREFLTLQTCWPPGTTLKRLLVFAVRVAD